MTGLLYQQQKTGGRQLCRFVIRSVPGFPASRLSPATPDVVLFKENHMQLTEVTTLDRKFGEGEGSAVRHSCAPPLSAHNLRQPPPNLHGNTNLPFVIPGFQERSEEPQMPRPRSPGFPV
jgi:hypothetical protein